MGRQPNLEQLTSALGALKAELAKVEPLIVDESTRQQFHLYSTLLEKAQAEVMATYPQAVASLKQRMDQTRQSAEATQRRLGEVMQQAAAARAAHKAASTAPTESPESVDPDLGRKLRDELLERFGDGLVHSRKAKAADVETLSFLKKQRF
jgi:hypothetical protein